MNGDQKLQPHHLARKAVVYLRQSSMEQVKNNLESQRLQYALADRARALGFQQTEIIDVDLGYSAAAGARTREGFERLLAMVALNEVGLVMSRELSRLSRTDKDFCRLLEVCQLFDTLIGDEQCLYNMSSLDDALVLGIKGTLSVVELRVLRMRLDEGKRNKARRGELYGLLPPGYVLGGGEKPVKDPDARVREAIELVFTKFREVRTIRQTMLWFRSNRVELPTNKPRGGQYRVVFQLPSLSLIRAVLENPFYAGAYVWGRRPMKAVWEGGVVKKRQSAELPLGRGRGLPQRAPRGLCRLGELRGESTRDSTEPDAALWGRRHRAGAQQAGPAHGQRNGVEPGRGEDGEAAVQHRRSRADGGRPRRALVQWGGSTPRSQPDHHQADGRCGRVGDESGRPLCAVGNSAQRARLNAGAKGGRPAEEDRPARTSGGSTGDAAEVIPMNSRR